MTTHLSLQRMLLPTAQVSDLTTGSITLPSARGAFTEPGEFYSIATVQGDGSSATLSLTSIPQTYTHLQLRFSLRSSSGTGVKDTYMKFNSDTGTYYTRNWEYTINGAGPYISQGSLSSPASIGYVTAWDTYSTTVGYIDILDYTNTSKCTTARVFLGNERSGASAQSIIVMGSNTYSITDAINSIELILNGGNFTSVSKLALYGIKES